MTYYKDLSSYEYIKTKAKKSILNVGWLDKEHSFSKGKIDSVLLEIILSFCKKAINKTRGYHLCPFCDEPSFGFAVEFENEKIKLGSGEIWLKGEEGKVYAAPDLIYHYIKDHGYVPPEAFLIAVKRGETVIPEYDDR